MPYYSFEIEAATPKPVVMERLAAAIDSNRSFRDRWNAALKNLGAPAKPFIGSINGDRFKAWRRIGYRNSFLPVVVGEIESRGMGTTVRIHMRLHWFVVAFLAFWLATASSGVFAAYSRAHSVPLEVAAFPLFAVVLTLAGFVPEAIKAKRLLVAVVNAVAPNNSSKPTPLRGAA